MRRFGIVSFLAAVGLAVVGFWLWNATHAPTGNLLREGGAQLVISLGRLAALLAVFGLFLQFVFISRAPWIEPLFGMDRLTVFHHRNAAWIVPLLLAHPILLTWGFVLQDEKGWIEQFLDFLENYDDVSAAAVAAALILLLGLHALSWIRRRFCYETWYFLHLLLYLAIGLSFSHQFEIGFDLTENRAFAVLWYVLYGAVLGNLLLFRVVRPLFRFWRHRFRVERLVVETGEVTSVYIAGRHLDRFRARAGQFVIVRFLCRGFWWEAHPFSLSAAPDGLVLRLSIKKSGDFTSRIPDLKPGTPVLIDGPHGAFTSARCRSEKVLLIAGGIGITPLRAIAEELLPTGKDLVLLYANRNRAGIALQKELEGLAGRGKLRIHHVLNADPEWPGEKGVVDGEKLSRLVPDLSERDVLLCGPPPMMTALRKTLAGMGVAPGRIHSERFAL